MPAQAVELLRLSTLTPSSFLTPKISSGYGDVISPEAAQAFPVSHVFGAPTLGVERLLEAVCPGIEGHEEVAPGEGRAIPAGGVEQIRVEEQDL